MSGAIDAVDEGLTALQRALVARAEEHADSVMPGFTHLQTAQPVTLGHHLMAYYEMLRRDRSRFADARARLNECPLGSAALAGTGFPVDRDATCAALDFDRPTANRWMRCRTAICARLSDCRDQWRCTWRARGESSSGPAAVGFLPCPTAIDRLSICRKAQPGCGELVRVTGRMPAP